MDSKPLLSVRLPIELKNSNDGQGRAWFATDKSRKSAERTLRELGHVREPFGFPVVVHVTRVLGQRQRLWDSSSGLRGNYKQIEDALVACGWFTDDGPDYIHETRFFQDATQKSGGASVVLEVWPA